MKILGLRIADEAFRVSYGGINSIKFYRTHELFPDEPVFVVDQDYPNNPLVVPAREVIRVEIKRT